MTNTDERVALKTIAEWPISHPGNMDAVNMAAVAAGAMTTTDPAIPAADRMGLGEPTGAQEIKTVSHHLPADAERYPAGCPDPDWCRGNRLCYWNCVCDGDDDGISP